MPDRTLRGSVTDENAVAELLPSSFPPFLPHHCFRWASSFTCTLRAATSLSSLYGTQPFPPLLPRTSFSACRDGGTGPSPPRTSPPTLHFPLLSFGCIAQLGAAHRPRSTRCCERSSLSPAERVEQLHLHSRQHDLFTAALLSLSPSFFSPGFSRTTPSQLVAADPLAQTPHLQRNKMVHTVKIDDSLTVPTPGFGGMGMSQGYGKTDDEASKKVLRRAIELVCLFSSSFPPPPLCPFSPFRDRS